MARFKVEYYTVKGGKTIHHKKEVEAKSILEVVDKVQGATNQRIYVTEITKGD